MADLTVDMAMADITRMEVMDLAMDPAIGTNTCPITLTPPTITHLIPIKVEISMDTFLHIIQLAPQAEAIVTHSLTITTVNTMSEQTKTSRLIDTPDMTMLDWSTG